MTYRLHDEPTIRTVWDSLPPDVSAQLTLALAQVCNDPLGSTAPYGEDDGVMRTLVLDHLMAVLYLGHQTKTVHVFQIDYLG
ncbi:hypothetical protein [Kitasatospora sp. NPDC057223]|uniref:hypothetical protein n=1 Tax=Kitasatospora sp. NPDC057223 TaxID=3346055 RepID=UPI00362CCE24